jgi:hypothetical protein
MEEEAMAKNPKEWLEMPLVDLMEYTLSGQEDSYAHRMGQTAVEIRTAQLELESSKEVAKYTKDLACYTKWLALSTWGVAFITLVTQISLIILTARR